MKPLLNKRTAALSVTLAVLMLCLFSLLAFGSSFLDEAARHREMVGGLSVWYFCAPFIALGVVLAVIPKYSAKKVCVWVPAVAVLFSAYASATAYNIRNMLYFEPIQNLLYGVQSSSMVDATSQRTVANFASMINFALYGLLTGLVCALIICYFKRLIKEDTAPAGKLFSASFAFALAFGGIFIAAVILIKNSFGNSVLFYCLSGLLLTVSAADILITYINKKGA